MHYIVQNINKDAWSTELGMPGILSIKLLLPLLLQPLLLLHKGLNVVPGSHLLSLAGCCLPPVLLFNACYHSIHLSSLSCKLLLQDLRLMTKHIFGRQFAAMLVAWTAATAATCHPCCISCPLLMLLVRLKLLLPPMLLMLPVTSLQMYRRQGPF